MSVIPFPGTQRARFEEQEPPIRDMKDFSLVVLANIAMGALIEERGCPCPEISRTLSVVDELYRRLHLKSQGDV
ncbi:hypothetical protein HW090_03335 [Pseudomonas sp. ABC1]|uniref:hypothetical protein n=1 Tax=Pseudomonas sp. ABC1 TaxID=2748080 RepID=UPI0015C40872|nr:hypothetical protein [Pseudomonas sp. ABC1]QLF92285.1 hypothetical protein HW090_03335 [Pseudomonas sp. ABC1]